MLLLLLSLMLECSFFWRQHFEQNARFCFFQLQAFEQISWHPHFIVQTQITGFTGRLGPRMFSVTCGDGPHPRLYSLLVGQGRGTDSHYSPQREWNRRRCSHSVRAHKVPRRRDPTSRGQPGPEYRSWAVLCVESESRPNQGLFGLGQTPLLCSQNPDSSGFLIIKPPQKSANAQ